MTPSSREAAETLGQERIETVGIDRVNPFRVDRPVRDVPEIDRRVPARQW